MVEILIASSPGCEMMPLAKVNVIAGRGLEGDRYYAGLGTFSPQPPRPDFEITLIEQENIQEFAAESGLPFRASHARRNVVTSGVRLNALVGKEFFMGQVRIRGMRLCEPCSHLAKTSFPETLKGLLHKGGLRAQILVGGQLRVGDEIRVLD